MCDHGLCCCVTMGDVGVQERQEFEQELNQQRESSSMMKDQLRKEHEEEISALMDENSKLEEELQEAKRKVHS